MKLDTAERAELMAALAHMQAFLLQHFGMLTSEEARKPGPANSFSPVEQVWHLADLEREGFGSRIRRLHTEHHPHLCDFDGDKIAKERNYQSLSLAAGLKAFAAARMDNLSYLQSLSPEDWSRTGTQDGVGVVALCDLPVLIGQHDRAHVEEILAWKDLVAR
jgi:hypothetical protein